MKKFRFLLVVLGLFALLGFSKTVKAAETVTVSVIVKLDNETKSTSSPTATLGGTYTNNPLAPASGATFMFWTVNGAVRADLPQNLTIKVPSKLELVAHFASTDKYSVVFLDTNSKLLKANFVSSGNPIELPDSNPSK